LAFFSRQFAVVRTPAAKRPLGLQYFKIAFAASSHESKRHRKKNESSRLLGIGSCSHSPLLDITAPACRTAYLYDPSRCLHRSMTTGDVPSFVASLGFHSHDVDSKLIACAPQSSVSVPKSVSSAHTAAARQAYSGDRKTTRRPIGCC
jgi:hypothetical protein